MHGKNTLIISVGVLFFLSIFFVPNTSGAKTIEWKLPTTFPATNKLVSVIWQGIVDDIYERTNGRLKITIYPGGELGYPAKEMLRFLRDGIIPIAEVAWPYAVGDFPLGKFCGNLFIARDFDDWYRVVHPIWLEAVTEPLSKKWKSMHLIHVPFAYVHLWTTDTPLTSLNAFKGRKFRIWEPAMGLLFEKLGTTTTYMQWSDVYMALQRGVIDGGPTGYTTALDAKLWEVAKYCTECSMVIPDNSLVMNKSAFESLPRDIQEIVLKVGHEWQEKCIAIQQENNDEAKEVCIKNGIKVVKMPDNVRSEIENIAKETWKDWAKRAGPEGEKALEKLAEARK